MCLIDLCYFAGEFNIIRLLVEGGADVNIRDGLGQTPLMIAVQYAIDSNIFLTN